MMASEVAAGLLELIEKEGDFDVVRLEVTEAGFTVNIISSDEGIRIIK